MAEISALLAAILSAVTVFLFFTARSTWKTASSKIAKVGKIQEENKDRLKKAREEAKQGRQMRRKAFLWGLLSMIFGCLLIWTLIISLQG